MRWHRAHGRKTLPWRQTRDPYAIMVSEFMLQQTQVATVIPYYERWLGRFPDFRALAKASESDVLHAWQGLGYYSRARSLHAAAREVVDRHNGRLPQTFPELIRLPGIGRYTANAILTFAFDQAVPVAEANITRVMARLFHIMRPADSSEGQKAVWENAARLVPEKQAGEFNSALMDLGALLCTARTPRCGACPVKPHCRAPDPARLPLKRARPATKRLRERHAFSFVNGKLLLQRCAERWRGMWMLPPMLTRHSADRVSHRSTFPFTHHQIELEVFRQPPRERRDRRWFSPRQLAAIPIPSPHRRAIDALLPNHGLSIERWTPATPEALRRRVER